MYELWIQDNTGSYQLADLGDDTPAINIQRNDIAELKDRQSDYSQALRLPKTPNNRRIFNFIDNFTVVSSIRHKRLGCRLYADGSTILGVGGQLKFLAITDYFEVQLIGANKGFFERLNGDENNPQKKLTDLRFDEYIARGTAGIAVSHPNNIVNRHCFFGIADFSPQPAGTGSFNKRENRWHIEGQLPFVKLKSIIDRILLENRDHTGVGYLLETDISGDIEYNNACLPLHNIKPDIEANNISGTTLTLAKSDEEMPFVTYGNISPKLKNFYASFEYYHLYSTVSGLFNAPSIKPVEIGEKIRPLGFTAPASGWYTFDIKYYLTSSNDANFLSYFRIYKAIKDDWGNLSIINQSTKGSTGGTVDFSYQQPESVKLNKGDCLFFFIYIPGTTVPNIYMYGFNLTLKSFEPTETTDVGNYISLSRNLPDMTQYDFFKAFLQLYGLTVDVDDKRKKVRAYTFNKIKDNKKNAIDWSKKYQHGSGKQKFTIGNYALNNYIKYKTEENDVDSSEYTRISEGQAHYMHDIKKGTVYISQSETGSNKQKITSNQSLAKNAPAYYVKSEQYDNLNFEDSGSLKAEDSNLKSQANLFELPFEATEYVPDKSGTKYLCKMRRYNPSEKTFDVEAPPKLALYYDAVEPIYIYRNNQQESTAQLCFITPKTAHGYSLQAQHLINKYYPVLQNNILKDMRFIEDAEFLLSPQDVEKFDPFIPVYIDYFGAYFYINKIKNFRRGLLTKVDLIKI